MFEIDCTPFFNNKFFTWQRGKRLRRGSLVLFSYNKFKTFKMGIIREARGEEMDKQMEKFGFCNIFVEIVNSTNSLLKDYEDFKNKELDIIEHKSFFESVIHCLETLQEINTFPFENIILGTNTYHNPPPSFIINNFLRKNKKGYSACPEKIRQKAKISQKFIEQ